MNYGATGTSFSSMWVDTNEWASSCVVSYNACCSIIKVSACEVATKGYNTNGTVPQIPYN